MRYPGFEVRAFLKDWIWLVFSLEQWILNNWFAIIAFYSISRILTLWFFNWIK
jgi:hypothetical protein